MAGTNRRGRFGLLRLGTVGALARLAWFFLTGSWLLVVFPRLNAGPTGFVARLALLSIRFAAFWTLLWLAVWQLAPGLLVETRAGLETLFQILPATIVAILVLVLGSVFVIAQVAASTWGTRAPVMISLDEDIVRTLARPVLLLVASLLLSGQVPDSGEPADAVTAAVSVLVLATVRMLVVAALVFPAIVQRYTAPRMFPQFVVEDLPREFAGRQLDLVVFRSGLLGEMLKFALRRRDSIATGATLEAILGLQLEYLRAREEAPELRLYVTEGGATRDGWLAEDLYEALVPAGEEALRLDVGADINLIARISAVIAENFDSVGDAEDAIRMVDGLTLLATTHVQVGPGTTNVYSEPVGQLAWLEAQAESRGSTRVAVHALAGWALGASYARYHLGVEQHALQPRSVRTFGASPPWQAALTLILSYDWQRPWANKLPGDLAPLAEELLLAAHEHAEHHGLEPPDLKAPGGE